MKVTGQSSLIAAQAFGAQRTNTDAKAASAAFFAELKKSTPMASQSAIKSGATSTATERKAETFTSHTERSTPLREAPLRAQNAGAVLPPGSYLNIVV